MSIIADTAFPRAGTLLNKLFTPSTFDAISNDSPMALAELCRQQKFVSLRKATEWGMRSLQGKQL
jgi:hypothetical protein